ncbi:MAG: hypothetical protein DMD99_08980 [Candidatus Rokuibacteriota bacterium]|nr:MAG: hypothetical protein DMD99_08980 [Candidatus Rokubacteria bacterium]
MAVSLGLLTISLPAPDGQERIVNKQDADRIFGLNRSQWEAEVTRLVRSQGWKVQPSSGDTGTGVVARDPNTGVGLAADRYLLDEDIELTLALAARAWDHWTA